MAEQYNFRPAVREQVGLLIGLAGASGSGKTYSAMRLASGICGGEKFAVIDTEARRSLHYADMFKFDICDLHPPFRPSAYADAIRAADKAGYKVIVVDSMSHSWASEGGVLDWQEEELTRMAGDDYRKREACKMAAWIKPKGDHKKMVSRLLQVKATVILCFRAEEKVKMEKDAQNKTVIVPIGWQPICEKNLPFELTVSFLLTPDAPGMPKPLKLQEQHKPLFPLDKPINEESGKRVAEWAAGGNLPAPLKQPEDRRLTSAKQQPSGDPSMGKAYQSLHDELSAHCLGDMVKANELCREMSFCVVKGKDGESDKEYRFDLDKLPTVSEKWAGSALGKLRKKVESETAAQTKTDGDDLPVGHLRG